MFRALLRRRALGAALASGGGAALASAWALGGEGAPRAEPAAPGTARAAPELLLVRQSTAAGAR
jgi:hypothetical protein